MTETLLEVQGLTKRFPLKRARNLPWRRPSESWLLAVDGVDFAIAPGETVGLVGESGCGTSTLVRLVTRLIDASAGRIGFAGEEIGEIPARRFARVPPRAHPDGLPGCRRELEPALYRVPGNRRPVAPARPAARNCAGRLGA